MIKGRKLMLFFAVIGLASTSAVKAQDKVEASVGTEVISGVVRIWVVSVFSPQQDCRIKVFRCLHGVLLDSKVLILKSWT